MKISEEAYLAHYGILRKSGRYPWGSGGTQDQRNRDFLAYFDNLKKQGMSEKDICKGVGISMQDYRDLKTVIRAQQKAEQITTAEKLRAKGMSNVEIAKQMFNDPKKESTVRNLLDPGNKERAAVLQTTANLLKHRIDSTKGFLDVSTGVELHLGIAPSRLKAAVKMLEEQGYVQHLIKFPQLGTGKDTAMNVLCPPGTTWKEAMNNKTNIVHIHAWSEDGGRSHMAIDPPLSIGKERVAVRYKEDGGAQADGVIYVRRGVPDVDLGSASYAQVRVAVNGTHFLKGMAVYKDDMPDGVDLVFNTNKSKHDPKIKSDLDAMKPMRDEPIDSPTYNPFGSFVRQLKDDNGNVRSAMNLVNEEGDWDKWSDNLSTQFLSKQNLSLAKGQLDLAYRGKKNDLEEILSLTNPAVRKKLLMDYADDADAAGIHLKAMGMAGQRTQVILPLNSMKETEVYAPNFTNGERVVLVRFPHGGTFEIPELVVNNKNPAAIKALGKEPKDAIGINPKVAERLSGADFDGDTVLVIPNNASKVKNKPPLQGLKNFDHQTMYKAYEGMPKMTPRDKQREMGYISNLITDMTIKGANDHELAAAVRHSMVVIDAEKHHLDYKRSAQENNITSLKRKYQGSAQGGAATLISKSGLNSKTDVPERKQLVRIDPATGKNIYTETGRTYVNKEGKVVKKTQKVPRLSLVDDAHDPRFSSGTPMERIYADHSNRMKALANQARKEYLNTPSVEYSPSARKAYAKEVARLESALDIALKNAPLERQAQLLARANVDARKRANPDMDDNEYKKLKNLALLQARGRVGASREAIKISDSEWAAIQAGALTQTQVSKILRNTDMDLVKQRATPRTKTLMTSAKLQRALSLANSGKTQAEIASLLGVSLTTLKRELGSL